MFDQELASLVTRPRAPDDIVNEIIGLDKEILQDIRWLVAYTWLCKNRNHPDSGKEADIGLSDYISLMSQPAYIMKVTKIINH